MTETEESIRRRLRWHSHQAVAARQEGDFASMLDQYRSCDSNLDRLLVVRPDLKDAPCG